MYIISNKNTKVLVYENRKKKQYFMNNSRNISTKFTVLLFSKYSIITNSDSANDVTSTSLRYPYF